MKKKSMAQKILFFVRPYLKEQILTFFCLVLGSIVSLQYPLIIQIIVDDILIDQNIRMLLTMLVVYIVLFLLGFLFTFLTQSMNVFNSQFFAFNVKKSIYNRLGKAPMSYLNKINQGEIVSVFNADIDTISRFFATDLLVIANNILNVIVIMVITLILNWQLAMLLACVLPFFYLAILVSRGYIKKNLEKRRELVSTQNKLLQNVFSNIKLVKLFVAQHFFYRKFLTLQNDRITTEIRAGVLSSLLDKMAGLVLLAGNVIIIWFGSNMVFRNTMTIGSLMAFYTYVPLLFNPIRALVGSSVQLRGFKIAFNRINKFLDIDEETDITSKYRLQDGNISFQNLSFAYDSKPVLTNINIDIKSGEKIALIGKNGSGKTTLVNLLLRLYDFNQGRIMIDGTDIINYSKNYLRRNIGIVTQETIFFNLSIEENMMIAARKFCPQEMIKACQITGAHQFIQELPQGYRTIIGEKGNNFSGGQMQKLAISRLILKNPKIILFDEATSALDPEATQIFYSMFDTVFKDRTIIFILHDLKSLSYADRIIVLKEGTIDKEYLRQDLQDENELIKVLTKEIA